MEPASLFLSVISDLADRVRRPDEYGMLRAAALLRQLLLDERRLIDEVNRVHRLKIEVTVLDMEAYVETVLAERPVFYSVEAGIDPSTGAFGRPVKLSRDRFLKLRIMVINGHAVSAHDLIDQLAHIEGGVHIGSARTEKQNALAEAAKAFGIGGLPAGVSMIAAIGRVVLTALEPLRVKVASGS